MENVTLVLQPSGKSVKEIFIFSAPEKSKNIFVATRYAVFPNFCGGEAEGTSCEKTKQED